jgi:YVTN family beta-propeller protein
MTDIYFFSFESAFVLVFAFFAAIKCDVKRAMITGLIAVKGAILWAVFSGGFSALSAGWAYLSLFIAALGVIAALSFNAKTVKGAKGFAVLCLGIIFLALLSGGCGKNNSSMPAIAGEYKLDFVPSKVAMPGNDELFVGSERGKAVYIYDTENFKKKSSIAAGYMPVDMAFYMDKLYTANKASNTVTIHDMLNGKSVQAAGGGESPSALALDPSKGLLYVANTGSSNVAVINLKGDGYPVIKTITVGKWPADLYLSPDNRYLYVCCKYTNTVQIIDAEKEEPVFTRIDTGISPSEFVPISGRDIAIINEWEYAYNHQSSIIIFDRIHYNMEYDIMVDGGIFDAALSRSKRYLYVSVPLKDKIIFVDIKKRETVFEIKFKDYLPKWVCVSKDGRSLYVACQQSREILKIAVNGFR